MKKPTKPDEKAKIIKIIRRIAKAARTASVSRWQFCQRSHVTKRKVERLFGSYGGLVEAAGLVRSKFQRVPKHSDEEVIAEMVRVLRMPNSKLTQTFFKQNSTMCPKQCGRRFRSWYQALKAVASKLHPQHDRVLRRRIRLYTGLAADHSTAARRAAQGTRSPLPSRDQDSPFHAADGEVVRVREDSFLRFRSQEHAPINEQGVIFLFGMICSDLGYVVEKLKSGFPDCEAKRELRPGIWQRVRIEFEFRSRTFRTHGHDPQQCDVIVCWENNWPDCPIEVQELKSLLPRLSPASGIDPTLHKGHNKNTQLHGAWNGRGG
jgi:hypothetical protein